MSGADYGPLGKALEWGINVHMGQQFGLANQIVLLAACAGIVLLAVSAGIRWKRRPKGSLGVPPLPQDKRVLRGLLACSPLAASCSRWLAQACWSCWFWI
ncbi:MAG: PepSY domain-containing protein [Agrobacterium sp.]|nr:PepSY domain-containing protein [Agrobacterium sp.]